MIYAVVLLALLRVELFVLLLPPDWQEGAMSARAVNFHLFEDCNLRCRFCFATFRDVEGHLELQDGLCLLRQLREAGFEKINFAGGEPTLHPNLGAYLSEARSLGFVTSLVTNGARLGPLLSQQASDIDWIGFSIDSAREETLAALGRGTGRYLRKTLPLVDQARSLGIKIKLNTVVTRLNWQEDLSELVRRVQPLRWKVFQVLRVEGQNDGSVEELLISADEFQAFLDRHCHLAAEGFAPVAEDNDAMEDSYAMIDPLGRFYGNSEGRHTTSAPILEVGVEAALAQVGFSPKKLIDRGGEYSW